MKTNNKSPLRYPGGKTRACNILDKIFQEHFSSESYDVVLSSFFGGGSFEFYLQNKYGFEVYANDKFTPLYHFWSQAKVNNAALCKRLRGFRPVEKELFYQYRKEIMNLTDDPFMQACYYFVINRCSFSGATLSGGFSEQSAKKRFTASSIDRVKKLDLSSFTFHNLDFSVFIPECVSECKNKRKNTFLFLDPPYYLEKGSKLYGNKGDMHEKFDHKGLCKVLGDIANVDWMMTYNDCDYIRDLYDSHVILEVDWKYGMNKSKKSSEIVILSAKV